MAAQPIVDSDIDFVREALERIVPADRPRRIEVFRSSGPFIRAIVVSDDFQGQGATARQERMWGQLRGALPPDLLNRLFGVHPYTWDEFNEEFQEN